MALTFDQWYAALCHVEGAGVDWPPIGDDGQALGPAQMHPSFFVQWYRPMPGQWHDTWLQAFHAAAYNFWLRGTHVDGSTDRQMAVGFHLHGQPYASQIDMSSVDGLRYGDAFDDAVRGVTG